jgi:YihY family inner membrane protein
VARTVVREVRTRDVSLLAASIAYYGFVAVVPLLVLVGTVAAAVGGPPLRAAAVDLIGRSFLPVGREPVAAALSNTADRGATLLGLPVLVWGSLKLFRGVEAAFARIYGAESPGFLGSLRTGATVLAAVGVGVLGAIGLVGAVTLLRLPLAVVGSVGSLSLFAVLVAALVPVYVLTPPVAVTVRTALPGAAVTAIGWTLLGTGFAVYARLVATGQLALYGVLAGVVLLVTWFYLAGMVLLVGATLTAVVGGHLPEPDRQVQHPSSRDDTTTRMTDDDRETRGAPDIEHLEERVDRVRADLDAFETDVEERTVDRPDLEAELKRYVRGRMRRGHARGWGPYLVLLYGTVMTVAAFYLLSDLLAVVAMVIIFLSTLGLYVLFVLAGIGRSLLGAPGRALGVLHRFRR